MRGAMLNISDNLCSTTYNLISSFYSYEPACSLYMKSIGVCSCNDMFFDMLHE